MAQVKPYTISKQVVWEAYQKVKANKGAAGVDGQSIEAFETDLKNNLYKIWNRMSSGSYFPPPVRLVEIPKASGGFCPVGVSPPRARGGSRVGWRRWSSRCIWSLWSNRVSMTTRTGIVPASRPWTRWRPLDSGVGVRTG